MTASALCLPWPPHSRGVRSLKFLTPTPLLLNILGHILKFWTSTPAYTPSELSKRSGYRCACGSSKFEILFIRRLWRNSNARLECSRLGRNEV